jgi:hypothetical protein
MQTTRLIGITISILTFLFVLSLKTEAKNFSEKKPVKKASIQRSKSRFAKRAQNKLTSENRSNFNLSLQEACGTGPYKEQHPDYRVCLQAINLNILTTGIRNHTGETADILRRMEQLLIKNNENLVANTNSNTATQNLIQQQVTQNNKLLFETIQNRFNLIPAQLLTNEAFKAEINRLKTEILAEVDKRIPK